MIILAHHCVAILLANILIWAPFAQSMSTFSFCINPWSSLKLVFSIFLYIYIYIYLTKNKAFQKSWKMLFISSKMPFSFSRYSIFFLPFNSFQIQGWNETGIIRTLNSELFTKTMKLYGTSFWWTFSACFFHKDVPYLILYQSTKLQYLLSFSKYQAIFFNEERKKFSKT